MLIQWNERNPQARRIAISLNLSVVRYLYRLYTGTPNKYRFHRTQIKVSNA